MTGFPSCSTTKSPFKDLATLCDGLSTLAVGEKAIIGAVQPRDVDGLLPLPIEENAKIIDSDKYELLIVCVHLRRPKHTFLPACRGKVSFCALAMDFSPCLSKKRPSHGLGVLLRWPLSPVCRGKVNFRSPRRLPREASRGPRKWPGSSRAKKLSILTLFAS